MYIYISKFDSGYKLIIDEIKKLTKSNKKIYFLKKIRFIRVCKCTQTL